MPVSVAGDGSVVLSIQGEVAQVDLAAGGTSPGSVIGLVHLVANSGSEAGPLTTMLVLRADGRAGIWGTGGVAYEVD